MMTTPASAIKDQVRLLIDVQIETFRQPTPLNKFSTPRVSLPLRKAEDAVPRTRSDWHEKRHGTAIGEGVLAPRVQTAIHRMMLARTNRSLCSGSQPPSCPDRTMVSDGGQDLCPATRRYPTR